MTPDGDAKQRQQWKAALATTADCLSLEDLGRWADGSFSDADKTRASSHLAGCTRCQTELTMLQEFERATPRPEEQDVALFSPGADVTGAAVVAGNRIYIAFNSPDGSFGTGGRDLVIAAVAIPVRDDAAPGD